MENKYVYKNPLDNGYIKFKITKKQHNKLFKYRRLKWFNRYEYYYSKEEIIIHNFKNLPFRIMFTIGFPLFILLNGLVNFKESFNELNMMWNQKKYGRFSSDSISSKSDLYKEIINVIKNNLTV